MDEAVAVRIAGLEPDHRVTVRATCIDARDVDFTSWADYRVSADGTVDPTAQPSLAGTYRGVDPYGLWRSMQGRPEQLFAATLAPVPTAVRIEADGELLVETTMVRRWLGPGVTATPVADGVVGTLCARAGQPAPGVVVLGGSDGNRAWPEGVAALLASRGFTALALSYFGEAGLPSSLVAVPVEYLGAAISWLRAHPLVIGKRVAVAGASRGAELALLGAAMFAEVGAVVNWAPSSVCWTGLAAGGRPGEPAWTWGGRALPFVVPESIASPPANERAAATLAPRFSAALARERSQEAAIPVERIRSPLLLVSGGDDQLWPSSAMADAVVRRLKAHAHPYPVHHLRYPKAGHFAGRPPGMPAAPPCPRHPVDGRRYAVGGTPAHDVASGADAWPRIVAFLREHIESGVVHPRMQAAR